MEKIKLMVTENQAKRIFNLVKKIRITREEWCDMVNENLRKINTYENKTDAFIIIEALKHYLYDEEDEVENIYESLTENQPKQIPKEEKNDKAN